MDNLPSGSVKQKHMKFVYCLRPRNAFKNQQKLGERTSYTPKYHAIYTCGHSMSMTHTQTNTKRSRGIGDHHSQGTHKLKSVAFVSSETYAPYYGREPITLGSRLHQQTNEMAPCSIAHGTLVKKETCTCHSKADETTHASQLSTIQIPRANNKSVRLQLSRSTCMAWETNKTCI